MVNDGALVVAPDRVVHVFDDERLVADAGIVLPATLTVRLGVEALVDEAVDLGGRPGAANARQVMTLVAAMALGADSIDDCDILRAGRTAAVLGHRVAAPSTLGTFLRAFSFGHVRQLGRVLGLALERASRAGAGPGCGRLVVDVDSFVGEVHGYQKQGASFSERDYHPLLASRADTGEVLHVRLRKGSANTARGAQRFVEELIARVERAGGEGEKLLPADSGLLVEQDLHPPGAGGLALLDWGAPAGARTRRRDDHGGCLADARRLPADERGTDRRDLARGPAPDRAQGAHARRPGRPAAELGAPPVRDQPRRRARARRGRAPPACRRRAHDPRPQRPGARPLPLGQVLRQRRLVGDRLPSPQPPALDRRHRPARPDRPHGGHLSAPAALAAGPTDPLGAPLHPPPAGALARQRDFVEALTRIRALAAVA